MLARNHYRLQISTFWTFFSRIWLHLSIVWKDQQMHLLMFRAWLPYNDSFFQLGILRDDDEVFLVFPSSPDSSYTKKPFWLRHFFYFHILTLQFVQNHQKILWMRCSIKLCNIWNGLAFECDWSEVIFHVSKNGDFSIRNKVKPLRNLFSKECLL